MTKPDKALAHMERLEQWLEARDEDVLLADGFEGALVGICQVFTHLIAIYDFDKSIEVLMKRDGMTREEAEEYFEFNVQGAYVGDQTPGFMIWRPGDDDTH